MPRRRIQKLLNLSVALSLPVIFLVMALRANGQAEPETVRAATLPAADPVPEPEAVSPLVQPPGFRRLELSRELDGKLSLYRSEWSDKDRKDVVDTLLDIESEYGFSPSLFIRLMEVESSFDINAVSKDGARGLCQIQPGTARQLSRKLGQPPIPDELLFDPVLNLRLSAAYLNILERKYKALPKAVSAYNMGPGAFSRIYGEGGIPRGRYHELLTR